MRNALYQILRVFMFLWICLAPIGVAQGQTFDWARKIGGGGWDSAESVAVDAGGNVFTIGYFQGPADFDPGPAVVNLDGDLNFFISKLDVEGNFVWAKSFAGDRQNNNISPSLAVGNDGAVYLTGQFRGTTDFDPGPTVYELSAKGVADIFIAKLESDGSFAWARQIGSATDQSEIFIGEQGMAIAVDTAGNVYSTGTYWGPVDFNPGVGVFMLQGSYQETYVLKLTTSGVFAWAKNYTDGPDGSNSGQGRGIAVDFSGNVFVTGTFYQTTDFDSGLEVTSLTPTAGADGYIVKHAPSGRLIWVKHIAGEGDQLPLGGIALDPWNNIYVSGHFYWSAVLTPGASECRLTGAGISAFVAKFRTNGECAWGKVLTTPSDVPLSTAMANGRLAVDGSGNVYAAGWFLGTIDFNPGPGSFRLSTNGESQQPFVAHLTSAGKFAWAVKFGGSGTGLANGVAVGGDRTVVTAGRFNGPLDFNPGSGTFNLRGNTYAVFLSKLSQF